MNAQQRKYLIDKITERTRSKIDALKASIPEPISLNVYMLHKVMSNDFDIHSNESLKKIVLEKALKAGQEKKVREDWLGNGWQSADKKNISFTLEEFFVIPQEYLDMREERNKVIDKVNQEIAALKLQLETLEIRIMIASDKVLQSIVNEVDDMGDIRLIDTKIKLIGS
jgi:CRISPR/Cas system CMR subunit Cmr4 (Cas7 group RAMP superfamily)